MNLSQFMFKQLSDEYTCLHFTRDVWKEITGEDLSKRLGQTLDGEVKPGVFKNFEILEEPKSPCLVYMLQLNSDPHIGVYIEDGMLHLAKTGPEHFSLNLAGRGFTAFRFYR